ncbi:MAG: hypothetical protein AAGL29_04380 [Bacteroidota bacterium]
MKKILVANLMAMFTIMSSWAQQEEKVVYMDLAHGQRMWNDPKQPVPNIGFSDSTRIQYMNEELSKTLKPYNAKVVFLKEDITYNELKKGHLLILHVPSLHYSRKEVKDIKKYVRKGGSLLMVMEADYWTDIDKTNVNEIIDGFGMQYGTQSKDTLFGGYTKKGDITSRKLKVVYELGRSIDGGEPFAFNSQTDEAFGVYKELNNGGRLVVLGDAMASLYMTEWRGVAGYLCQEFMDGIYKWLLRN